MYKISDGKVRSPLIHLVMGECYRKAVNDLRQSLRRWSGGEAKQHVRALIDKIVLTLKEDRKELSIDLYGDLGGLLKIASEDKAMKNTILETRKLEKKMLITISFRAFCSIGSGGWI